MHPKASVSQVFAFTLFTHEKRFFGPNKMQCEVGYFQFSSGISIPELATAHPKDFKSIIEQAACCYQMMFSNNPNVIQHFKIEDVIVVGKDGSKKTYMDHPKYDKWKNEFSPDEFYCIFGVDW